MVKLSEQIQKAILEDEKHNPTITYSWKVKGHPLEIRNVGYGLTKIYLDDEKVGSYEFLPAELDSRPDMNAYGMTVRFFNQDMAFKWLVAATTWYLKNSHWGYKHGMDPHKLIDYGEDKITTQEWDTVEEVVESFIDKEMEKVVDSFKKTEENQELKEAKLVSSQEDVIEDIESKFSDLLNENFYNSETLEEVAPPGMEDRVKSLKKHIKKSNPRISKKRLSNMAFGRAWNEYKSKKK